MSRLDLCDVMVQRLKEHGYKDAATRRIDELKAGGIAVRRLPSTRLASYFDGRRDMDAIVLVAVARQREEAAMDECEEIAALVPTLDLASANGSYEITSCDIHTPPREMAFAGGPTVWAVQFRAAITTTGRRY